MPYYNDPEENLALRRALRTGYNTAPDYNPALNKWQTTLGFESARHGFKANEYYEQALTAREENDIQKENYFRLLAEAEEREAARKAPKVQNASDIRSVGDLANWGLGAVGQAAASAEPIAYGIGGRLAGAALGALTGPAAPLMVPLLSNAGGFLGATIPAYQMERNETIGEAMRNDPENKLSTEDIRAASRGKGVAAGLMEAVVPIGVAKGLTSPLSKALPKGLANGISRGSLIETGLAEGLTEGAQSLAGQSAQKYLQGQPMFSDFDWVQAANEAAAGAVGGVGLAAPVKGVNYAREKFFASPEAQQGRQDGANLAGAATDAVGNATEKGKGFWGTAKEWVSAGVNAARNNFGSKAENTVETAPNATPEPGVEATAQAGVNEEAAAQQTQGISGAQDYVNKNKYTQKRGLYFKDGQPYEVDTGWHATNKTKFDPDHPVQKARNGDQQEQQTDKQPESYQDFVNDFKKRGLFSKEANNQQSSDYWLDKQGRPATYKGRPVTKAQGIRASLTRHFKGVNEANKNIFIANNVDEVLQTMGQDPHAMELAQAIQADPNSATNYKAFTTTNADGSPRVVMIANNIKQGEEFGVFLHEVGVHVGMRNAFSGFEVNKIAESVRSLAQDSDPITRQIAEKALARAEGTNRLDEEVVAYFVEEAMRATDADGKPVYQPKALKQKQSKWRQVLDKVISLIKQFLSKLGVKPKTPLTPQQIIDTAFGLAQKESQNLAQQSVVEETAAQQTTTEKVETSQVEIDSDNTFNLDLARHLFDETEETQAMADDVYDDSLITRATQIANKIRVAMDLYIPEIQEATRNFFNTQDYGAFVEQINTFFNKQISAWTVDRIYKKLGVNKKSDLSFSTEEQTENIQEQAENETEEFIAWATGDVQKQLNKQEEERNTKLYEEGNIPENASPSLVVEDDLFASYYVYAPPKKEVVREKTSPNIKLDEGQEALIRTMFAAVLFANKNVNYSEIIDVYRSSFGKKLPKVFGSIYQYMREKNERIGEAPTFTAKNFSMLQTLQRAYDKSIEKVSNFNFEKLLADRLFNDETRKKFHQLKRSNFAKFEEMRDKAQEVLIATIRGVVNTDKEIKIKAEDTSAYENVPTVAAQYGSVTTKLDLNRLGELFAKMVDEAHPEREKKAPLFVKTDENGNRRPLDVKEWRKALIEIMSDEIFMDAFKTFASTWKSDNGRSITAGYYDRLQEMVQWNRADEPHPERFTPLLGSEFLWREFLNTKQDVVTKNINANDIAKNAFEKMFDKAQVDSLFLYPENFSYEIPWLETLINLENPNFSSRSEMVTAAQRVERDSVIMRQSQALMFKNLVQGTSKIISDVLDNANRRITLNTADNKGFNQFDVGEYSLSEGDVPEFSSIDELLEHLVNEQKTLDVDDEEFYKTHMFDALAQFTKNEIDEKTPVGGVQVHNIKPLWTVIPNLDELRVFQLFEEAQKSFDEQDASYGKNEPPKLDSELLANVAASIPMALPDNWMTADNEAVLNYLNEKLRQGVEYQKVSPLIGSLLYVSSHMGNLDPAWIWSKDGLKRKVLSYAIPHLAENYLKGKHTKAEIKKVRTLLAQGFSEIATNGEYLGAYKTTHLPSALELAKIISKDESTFMIVLNEPLHATGDTFNVPLPNIKTSVHERQLAHLLNQKDDKYLANNIEAEINVQNFADNAVFIETKDAQGNWVRKGVNLKRLLRDVQWKDKRFQIEDTNIRDWKNPNDTGFFSLFCAAVANLLYVDPNTTGRIGFAVTPYQQERAGIAPTEGNYQTFMVYINEGSEKNRAEGLDDTNCYVLLWRKDHKGNNIVGLPPIGVKYKNAELLFDDPFLTEEGREITTKVKAVIFPTLSDLRALEYDGNMEELLQRLPVTGIPKYLELFPKTDRKESLTMLEAVIRKQQQDDKYKANNKWGYSGDTIMPKADFWSMGKALWEQSEFTQKEKGRIYRTGRLALKKFAEDNLKIEPGTSNVILHEIGPHGEWPPIPKNVSNFSFTYIKDFLQKVGNTAATMDGRTFADPMERIEWVDNFVNKILTRIKGDMENVERSTALNPANNMQVPLEFELTPPDNKEFQERAKKALVEQYFKTENANRYLTENVQAAEQWADKQLKKMVDDYKEILKDNYNLIKPTNTLDRISKLYNVFYGDDQNNNNRIEVTSSDDSFVNVRTNKHRQFGKDGLLVDPNNIFGAVFAPLFDALENTTETDANKAALQSIRNALDVLENRTNKALGFYIAKDNSVRVTAKVPKLLIQDIVDLWYEISAAEQEIPGTERLTKIWDEEAQKRFENAPGHKYGARVSETPTTPKDEFMKWEEESDKKFGLNTLLDYPEFKEAKNKFAKKARIEVLQEKGIDSQLSFQGNQDKTEEINKEVQARVDEWVKQQQAGAFLALFKHDIENLGRELMAALRMGQQNAGARQGSTKRSDHLWGESPKVYLKSTGERIESESPWHYNRNPYKTYVAVGMQLVTKKEKGKVEGRADDLKGAKGGAEYQFTNKTWHTNVPKNKNDLRVTSAGITANRADYAGGINNEITDRAHENPDFTDDSRLIDFWNESAKNNDEDIHSTSMGTDKHVFKQRGRVNPVDLNNEIVDKDYVRFLDNTEIPFKKEMEEPKMKSLDGVGSKNILEDFNQKLEKENSTVTLTFTPETHLKSKGDIRRFLVGKMKNGEWIEKGPLYKLENYFGHQGIENPRTLIDRADSFINKGWVRKVSSTDGQQTISIKIPAKDLKKFFKDNEKMLPAYPYKWFRDAYIAGTITPDIKLENKGIQTEYEKNYEKAISDWDYKIADESKRANRLRLGNQKQIDVIKIDFNPKSNEPGALFHPGQYAPADFELEDADGVKRTYSSPLQAFRALQSGKFDAKAYYQRTQEGKRATFPVNLAGENSLQDDEALDLAITILQEAYEQDPTILRMLEANNFYKDKEFVFDLGGTSRKPKFWEENYPDVLRTALFRIEQDLKNNPELIQEAEKAQSGKNKDPLGSLTKGLNKNSALNVLAETVSRLDENDRDTFIPLQIIPTIRQSDGKPVGFDEKTGKYNPYGAIYKELERVFSQVGGVLPNNARDLANAVSDWQRNKYAPQEINGYWNGYLSVKQIRGLFDSYLFSESETRSKKGVDEKVSDKASEALIRLAKMIINGGFLAENSQIDPSKHFEFYKNIVGEQNESSKVQQYRQHYNREDDYGHLLNKNDFVEELPSIKTDKNTNKEENVASNAHLRDDVPFSKLLMETPLDPKERADSAVDWISKVLPKDTIVNILKEEEWGKQGFDKDTYGSFTEKDGKKVISLALSGDVLSTAHHEAAHAMLSVIKKFSPKHYDKLISLSQKYKDVVLKVLHDKHAANAIKDVENNPEELASYAYQLWMAGLIPSNALSKRVAGRIGRMWLRVAGLFNDALRRQSKETDSILEAETKLMLVYKRFNDGMLGPEHSEESFYRQLEADLNATKMQERWNKVANFIGKYADQLVNASDTVLRRADIPELTEIADMFYVDVVDHDMSSMHEKGEKGGALSRYRQLRFKWENAYNRIIEDLDEKEKNKIRHALLMEDTGEALRSLEGNQKLQKGYKEMRKFFDNVFKEIHEKPGVNYKNQGNYEAHFFPFLWNREAIKKNRQEFTEMLMEELKKEGLGDHYILDKDGGRIKVSALENAERYVAEILGENMPAGQNKEQPFWIKKGTFEQNVEARYLGFIKDRPKFDKFFEQSLDTVMHEYLVRSSKNAIFQEVFGNNGEKLRDLFKKATGKVAEKHGLINPLGDDIFQDNENPYNDIRNLSENVTPGWGSAYLSDKYKGREKEISESIVKLKELMAPYYRAVDSMSGMLGTDMSPQMRKFNAIGVTYQNIRLLLTVLFSSFQDIAGLSFHGGTLKDQWDGFRRGVREAFGVAAKKKSKDFWIKRAEEFGIVAPLSSIGMVQELVGTQHLTGFWGKVNKVFFRINGMEGWNRGLRAQSMIIAERKIKEWAETKALDPDIPTDGLLFKRCFGSQMKPGDIELERGEDGKMYVANNEANRIAMARIVDDMIMNPTEANRPMWANDPRFMLFAQLKTFSYTLHRVMLRGVAEQLRLGNYAPATAALMGMVPMAFTGYVIKEMILGMIDDDDDDWKFQLQNLIPYSINRSGIGGIPQMYLEDILDVDPARLFGPTVDQVQNILSIPLRGWNPEYLPGRVSHMHNWNNELVAALPGGTLLKRVPGLVDQSA